MVLLVISINFIRRHCFEFFVKLHISLALAAVVLLWFHLPNPMGPNYPVALRGPRAYIIALYAVWAADIVLRALLIVYRSFKWQSRSDRPSFLQQSEILNNVANGLRLSVTVARPWDFQAGQTVYITIPSLSFWAFSQAHPFVPVWWRHQADGTAKIELLIRTQTGFTLQLSKFPVGAVFRTVVEEPYGYEQKFGSFGTVLIFAKNFGIAAQLPYLKRLVEDFKERTVVTRQVHVYWQVNQEVDAAIGQCVADWINDLLRGDTSLPYASVNGVNDISDEEVDRLAVRN